MGEDPIYEALTRIVGPEWVSKDPAILTSYSRDLGTLTMIGRPRRPEYVVLPSNVIEVQHIVQLIRISKIPLYTMSTGINVSSSHIPKQRGMVIDFKRMNRILEIDEENFKVTIEPAVTFAMLNCELQKRGLHVAVPGAPSTAGVISNYICFGNDNRGDNKVGWQFRHIMGYEAVMADGNVYRVGSWSNEFDPKDSYWPHGPGPSAQYLARPMGTMGVITKGVVKCWPLGTEFKPIIAYFNDIDAVCKALKEVAIKEIGHGLLFYAGHKYSSYACDAGFSQYRLNRFHPEFIFDASVCGSKRRVEYEERAMREVIKKHGGRFISEKFSPWKSFEDSRISVVANMCAWGAIRYFGWRKPAIHAHVFCTMDSMPEAYKILARTLLEDEWAGNPNNYPHAEFSLGAIAHPSEGAHVCRIEISTEGNTQDPELLPNLRSVTSKLTEALRAQGFYSILPQPLTLNPDMVEVGRRIKESLDPDNLLSPGTVFPGTYPFWRYSGRA